MFNLENSTKNAYALTFPFFRFPYEESVSESLIFGENTTKQVKYFRANVEYASNHDVAVSKNDDCYCCYYDVMMTQLWEE